MKNNIFLFTGDDAYYLQEELKKRKNVFSQKHGGENIFQFKSNEFDYDNIFNTIFSGGLFFSKKLIIIHGLPKDSFESNKLLQSKIGNFEEKFMSKIDQIDSDTIIVFVSYQPDKRTKFFKFLKDNSTVKTFSKKRLDSIVKIINDEYGSYFKSKDDIKYFVEKVGKDMFLIMNEILKLKSYFYINNETIDKSKIDSITFSGENIDVFIVLDKLFSDKEKTIKLLENIKQEGASEIQILGMLSWSLRSTIYIIDSYLNGNKSSKDLASVLSLHPFVVSKTLKNIDFLKNNYEKIKNLFFILVEIDYSLKSGKIPANLVWLNIKKAVFNF